jgi:hypothetical protein
MRERKGREGRKQKDGSSLEGFAGKLSRGTVPRKI